MVPLENSASLEWGAISFLNMIIKEKNGSLPQSGTIFQNSSSEEPF